MALYVLQEDGMERADVFFLDLHPLFLEGKLLQYIHHGGHVDVVGTSCTAGLTGGTEPDHGALKSFARLIHLDQTDHLINRVICLSSYRAPCGALLALVAVSQFLAAQRFYGGEKRTGRVSGFLFILSPWQHYDDPSSFSQFAVHRDVALMRVHDLFDDRETQSSPVLVALLSVVRSIELSEDRGKLLLWDAYPGIGDLDPRLAVDSLGGQGDNTFGRRVFYRIMDQFGEHLLQIVAVASDGQGFVQDIGLDLDAFLFRNLPFAQSCFGDDVKEPHMGHYALYKLHPSRRPVQDIIHPPMQIESQSMFRPFDPSSGFIGDRAPMPREDHVEHGLHSGYGTSQIMRQGMVRTLQFGLLAHQGPLLGFQGLLQRGRQKDRGVHRADKEEEAADQGQTIQIRHKLQLYRQDYVVVLQQRAERNQRGRKRRLEVAVSTGKEDGGDDDVKDEVEQGRALKPA